LNDYFIGHVGFLNSNFEPIKKTPQFKQQQKKQTNKPGKKICLKVKFSCSFDWVCGVTANMKFLRMAL
jgi:hypothetical protein